MLVPCCQDLRPTERFIFDMFLAFPRLGLPLTLLIYHFGGGLCTQAVTLMTMMSPRFRALVAFLKALATWMGSWCGSMARNCWVFSGVIVVISSVSAQKRKWIHLEARSRCPVARDGHVPSGHMTCTG